MRHSIRRLTLSMALMALMAACLACEDTAEPSAVIHPGAGTAGRILYLTYCQSCHGVAGRGDGPAAASLRTPPVDLTRLSEDYGLPLDRERLARYIDGRRLFGGHSPRDMPIWGDEFFEEAPPSTPNLENSKQRLFDVLVRYLESIQIERGA